MSRSTERDHHWAGGKSLKSIRRPDDKELKGWDEISKEFERVQNMPCVPGFTRLPDDWVIDEKRSLRWNMIQLKLNHKNYEKEVKELNTQKYKANHKVLEDVYTYIQYLVGNGLDRESAKKIWEYAYEQSHACDISEIHACLTEIHACLIKITKLIRNVLEIHEQEENMNNKTISDEMRDIEKLNKEIDAAYKELFDKREEMHQKEYTKLEKQVKRLEKLEWVLAWIGVLVFGLAGIWLLYHVGNLFLE